LKVPYEELNLFLYWRQEADYEELKTAKNLDITVTTIKRKTIFLN
jgi:hypothetical protein